MAEKKFDMSPVEPAHPMVVKLHEDLFSIYKHIRDKYQLSIDAAFDKISRQIGFIVTTTIPVVLEIGNQGDIKRMSMGAEHLKDTLFERHLSEAMGKIAGDNIKNVSAGTFNLLILWHEALKIKLKTDWMEPAHMFRGRIFEHPRSGLISQATENKPRPWEEPAHWFDPGQLIAVEEAVLIEAIDQVYPELKLVDRVSAYRAMLRRGIKPEVMEPAHFRPAEHLRHDSPEEILNCIRRLLV